jgi:iron-sulfur cluster assembly protein
VIKVTEKAANELKRAIEEHKSQDPNVGQIYVRVAVKGGGCSGYQWTLGLEEGITEKDQVVEDQGVKFSIDNRSALYMEGTSLDFIEDLNRRGFKFSNPMAKTTCGCGQSFSF